MMCHASGAGGGFWSILVDSGCGEVARWEGWHWCFSKFAGNGWSCYIFMVLCPHLSISFEGIQINVHSGLSTFDIFHDFRLSVRFF